MKVLVVDDDARVREMLHKMLPSLGHECTMAASGKEALGILKEEEYPIVISDILMPGMDGIEVIKEIKALHPDTDVISITGYAKEYSFTDVIQAGASDFILKPFSRDELEAKVRRVVREQKLKSDIIDSRNTIMAIFNGIRESMYTIDYDFKVIMANEAFAQSAHSSIEDTIGKRCHQVLFRKDIPCEGNNHNCPAKRSFARGMPAVSIHRCGNQDGTKSYREITAMPLIGEDGIVTQAILLSRDISSQYKEEKRLKESEESYRILVEMAHEGIMSITQQGIISIFNKKAEEMFGYSFEEMAGRSISTLIPVSYGTILKVASTQGSSLGRRKGSGQSIETMGSRKDGSKISIELTFSSLKDYYNELPIILFVREKN